MGRRKKEEILENRPCDYIGEKIFYYGDNYVCPVCNKTFKFTEEHKYIAKNSFTCSWECFLIEARSHPVINKKNKKEKEEKVNLGQLLNKESQPAEEKPVEENIEKEPEPPKTEPKKSFLVNLWE